MELYLSIAVGIVLGELGKELLYRIQNLWWSFKNRNKIKPDFFKWDETDELLTK